MDKSPTMYRVKPIFALPKRIELPTCMYSMKNISTLPNVQRTDQNNEILDSIMDKKPLPELSALEARWESVLQELSELKEVVNGIKRDLNPLCRSDSSDCKALLDKGELEKLKVLEGAVINANPLKPPYSLFLIKKLSKGAITFSSHVHSSSVNALPDKLKAFCQTDNVENCVKLVLIWKEGITDSELVLNPIKQLSLRGEVNILRHLGRIGLKLLKYPTEDAFHTVQIDSVMDMGHCLLHTQAPKEKTSLLRNLSGKLGRNLYYGGENYNISDISAWSALKQTGINPSQDLTPNMAKWYQKMDLLLN